MATRRQHSMDFRVECLDVGIKVRGLDVRDYIEAAIGERQMLRIALLEPHTGVAMRLLAKRYGGGGKIDSGYLHWIEEAMHHVDGPAASAADVKRTPSLQRAIADHLEHEAH